ncbi:MAG: TIGR00159 family protein [Oscillospiraceae bacterium]|nr:TIGR00159 family protein [Oscillospiraceae bacterium]
MQGFLDFFVRGFDYLATIQLNDIIDILIVAYLIYKIIGIIRKTGSNNLARGIVLVLVMLWLSGVLKLTMINYILRKAVEIGLIALVIIFQPELRKLLAKVGSSTFFYGLFSSRLKNVSELEAAITQTVLACEQMSATKTGALIIFERDLKLNDIITTGTVIDADITAELLKNVFYPKAPLHDGALVIRNGRIAAAGCVLPLTNKTNLSRDLGMRHRAGIGVSEQSDALVIIVSEETGAISVAEEGMLKRNLNRDTFDKLLRRELVEDEPAGKKTGEIISRIKENLKVKK